ncbi:MAG: hypothetical protein ACFFDN_13230 [Candidatus Hodarchaeota archaeon]
MGLGFYSTMFMFVAFGIVAIIVGIIGVGIVIYYKKTGKELPKLKKLE